MIKHLLIGIERGIRYLAYGIWHTIGGLRRAVYGIRHTVYDKKSFTLIEILVVLGILAIISTAGFVELSQFKSKHNFDLDAQSLTEAIGSVQSKAIQQDGGTAWGIRFTNSTSSDSYQIFQGSSYSAASVISGDVLSSATVYTNPPTGFYIDVVFAARTGLPTSGSATSIVLQRTGGSGLYTIMVSSAGRISKNLETGLVGYWPMSEGGGSNAYDASGNTNTGSIIIGASGTQTTVAQAWGNALPARVINGLNFDGTDDYTNCGSKSSLNLTSAFTFSAWIYPKGYSAENIIFNKESTYEWAIDSTTYLRWAIANTTPGWTWINTGLSAPLNQWTHFVVTYDGSSIVTYKNGGAQIYTYSSAGGSIVPNGNYFLIGARGGPASFFNGSIDDVRVYNRALSATEIQNLYNSY